MKAKFCVKKETLLLIAGIVWMIAGFNVARLGMLSYLNIERRWYLYFMSIFVFLLLGFMFFKMSQKHTRRIIGYEEYRLFWHFFDRKDWIINDTKDLCIYVDHRNGASTFILTPLLNWRCCLYGVYSA